MAGTSEDGKKAAATIREREGKDAMKKRGQAGGEVRKKGSTDYSELGKKGVKHSQGDDWSSRKK